MTNEGTQGKFVWPPRAPASEAAIAAGARTIEGGRERETRTIAAGASSHRASATTEPKPGRSWLRSIEEAWLGLTTPSFAERASDASWSPDGAEDYCGRCGHPTGPHESRAGRTGRVTCPNCVGTRPRYSRVVRLGAYDGLLRDAIRDVKFTAWRRLGTELGRLLGRQLLLAMEAEGVEIERVLLVPMPTTMRRRLVRGIDHTTVLARGVRDVLGAPIVHAVEREHRPSQTQVPRSQRRDNVARTMRLKGGVDLLGRLVVIIDDVMTTGSTMGECARAIREGSSGEKSAPLDVWAGVLGVAVETARGASDAR